MFATLNLQLPRIEIDNEALAPIALAPNGAPVAGFADLLQLRVDAAQGVGNAGGETLPLRGTDLPLQALPIELELPGDPNAAAEMLQAKPVLPGPGETDIVPEDPLQFSPVPLEAPPPDLPGLATPVAGTVAPAADQQVTDRTVAVTLAEGNRLSNAPQMRSVTAAPVQTAVPYGNDALELPLPVMQERNGQPAVTPTTVPEKPVALDLPRRADPAPTLAPGGTDTSDFSKARPVVTQVVQALNIQPNPQQAQPLFNPAPAAAADSSYAAAMQQATDVITTPVRDTAWGEQVGERVLLMAGNQMKTAEIRLTPAELGPLRVQVSMDDGAANVTFQAQHAITREAIEQALPRLRELLAENGLSLGQASVGEQGVEGRNRDEQAGAQGSAETAEDAIDKVVQEESVQHRQTPSGLVDTFV